MPNLLAHDPVLTSAQPLTLEAQEDFLLGLDERAVPARPSKPRVHIPDHSARTRATVARVTAVLGQVQDAGNMGEVVVDHGRSFPDVSEGLPRGMSRGQWGLCHLNSRRIALRNPEDYTYAEGFAASAALGDGVPRLCHAWLLDEDGLVVDRTWSNGSDYVGVLVPTSTLRAMSSHARKRRRCFAFVTDWEGQELLRNMGVTIEEALRGL